MKQCFLQKPVVFILVFGVVIGFFAFKFALTSRTPQFKEKNGNTLQGSIACLEKVYIGGVEQWILLRGKSVNNPVLLFLHGGPGSAEWPLVRDFNRSLEEDFVLVYWEQRGAGKSYSKNISNMHINQFVSDTHELVQYLQKRLNQEKVFLIGHSWGSLLGILTVQKFPELFHAYIGVSQVVSAKEQEKISYHYVMDMAIKNKNKKAIQQLISINPPECPYGTIDQKGKWYERLQIQRKWLLHFGGSIYKEKNNNKWTIQFFQAPEYSTFDLIKWVKGNKFSLQALWPEIMEYNLFEQIPELKAPVYFLVGRHDYNTPFELVERYYDYLKAPRKELIWFDHSAHSPMYEEAEKFNNIILNIKRKETTPTLF